MIKDIWRQIRQKFKKETKDCTNDFQNPELLSYIAADAKVTYKIIKRGFSKWNTKV